MDHLRQRIQHHARQNDSLLNSQIEVEEEINVIVDSYESATRYLGYKADKDVKLTGINPKNARGLLALNILVTIADAWNKADGFVPDFSNRNQYKWLPWFRYSDDVTNSIENVVDKITSNMDYLVGLLKQNK